ncbi:unnamed protein product, partial [Staurois parvus]
CLLVLPVSVVSQCCQSVPFSATYYCPSFAAYQCSSISTLSSMSTSAASSVLPISATYQCPSVLPISAASSTHISGEKLPVCKMLEQKQRKPFFSKFSLFV